MIEEKKKVNRPLVYAILGVTLLVLAVSGSAYAFFTAQATSDQFLYPLYCENSTLLLSRPKVSKATPHNSRLAA